MNIAKRYILIFFISFSYCKEQNANEIINRAFDNFNNKNCNFQLSIIKKQKSKPDKKKKYEINIFHPENDSIIRFIRVDTLEPKNLSDVSYWEHVYSFEGLLNRWITLPLTGKLKALQMNEKIGNDFNLEDIILKPDEILSNSNSVIRDEVQNDIKLYIIESKGNRKQNIWIDSNNYNVHKIEIFNKYNRVIKEIDFKEYVEINNVSIPQLIKIKDKKKKINYSAHIDNFTFINRIDELIFQPKGKK